MRRAVVLAVLLAATANAAEKTPPRIAIEEMAVAAARGSLGASLATTPDGELWLSWVEPAPPVPGTAPAPAAAASTHHHGAVPTGGPNTLRFAKFDAPAKRWSPPRTIATGHGVPTSSADFPQLVSDGRGRAFALWHDGRGGAALSESADGGATWSTPAPWTRNGNPVEKFSLVRLADGRVLAAWLDGRVRSGGGKAQQLFARVLGTTDDMLVDPSVCDCCQTTLAAFPDGGALLAYRGRTDQEVRDIRISRWHGGKWDEPRALNNDDWRIAACPINGPRLASDGGRIAAAWFTAADNDPRVLASFSPDAGGRFLMPLRIDRGKPAGRVDTLILHDGAMLVTWVENDGSVWLRRVTPDFSVNDPVALATAGSTSTKTVPRLALWRDYRGGKSQAQVIAAFAGEGSAPLRTLLISIPEGELLEFENECGCLPTPEQLQGFPLRGTVGSAQPGSGTLRVKHAELPGVFAAGTRDFKVAPEVLTAAQPGRAILGGVELREGTWWLFDLRLIGPP